MEDILEVYARPYDVKFPVVCMDESRVQLIGEVHEPISVAPGHPVLMDDEYVRKGVSRIFMGVEPLGGKREVKITERRTRIDWAHFIKEMLEERYTDAEKVVLVMDTTSIHTIPPRYTRPFRRLRRFAVSIIKSKGVRSVAQKMRQLTRNVRSVFDYLRMTNNSVVRT